ncbi:hypothetical protein [uncultured Algimonas sp.]|uniref:hypothetical protein n=1 Tax=uncultured Algimonas sp. TaxID=1547920 RepID=UPI002609423A|nr:hypothetical protein [uncultured Algimonas sp.]
MKRLILCALAAAMLGGTLSSCGGGSNDGEVLSASSIGSLGPAELADKAIADLRAATALLSGIETVGAAEAAIPEFQTLGEQYARVNAAMRNMDRTDQDAMMAVAERSPVLARQLQAFMSEVDAIQSRNQDAAQILLPHLRTFSGR